MGTEYDEIRESITVPKNTGRQGFLRAIEELLALPRVQEIHIDSRGKVDYRYLLRPGEQKKPALEPDFQELLPYAIIRNSDVRELTEPDENAAVAVSQLFDLASADHLIPIAFVAGPMSTFWDWYRATTSIDPLSTEELYGLPILSDRQLEDYVLVLCAGFSRNAPLSDTQKSYKLVIPKVNP